METTVRDLIKQELKSNPNWLETFDSGLIQALAKMNSDILAEKATVVEGDLLVEKKILPKKYFHRILLYEKLRQHKRCKKNDYGEKMLKLMKERQEV